MTANFAEAMEQLEAENAALKAMVAEMMEGLTALADEYDDPDLPYEGPAYRAVRDLISRAKGASS